MKTILELVKKYEDKIAHFCVGHLLTTIFLRVAYLIVPLNKASLEQMRFINGTAIIVFGIFLAIGWETMQAKYSVGKFSFADAIFTIVGSLLALITFNGLWQVGMNFVN